MGLRFPDWYYGGPFLPVGSPDSDLPVRDAATPIAPSTQARVETDGTQDGERVVAPFGDTNSVDLIVSELDRAAEYPEGWGEDETKRYPTIQGLLARARLRIETKLRRRAGKVRANWFGHALEHTLRAAELFAASGYAEGQRHSVEARDLMAQGNRASRRATTFIVAADGTTTKKT